MSRISFFDKDKRKARSFPSLLALAALGIMASVPAWPVLAQSSYELGERIERLEAEIETLGRAVYGGQKPAGAVGGGAAGGSADVLVRFQEVEREMREIRGLIEEQVNAVQQVRADMERVTGGLELRMNDLESGAGAAAAASPPAANYTAGGGLSSSSSRGADQRSDAEAAPAQGQEGGGYTWNSGASKSKNGDLGSYVEKTGSASNASRSGGDEAAALYENAFSLVKNSQYAAAEKEFSAFLSKYPDHVLAGNAKYWLGESYYVRGEFEKAARAFAEGYQKYPKGAKAADNLLKLGMALSSMGKKDDACVALGQLSKDNIPGSGPVMRRADQEKQRLGC